MVSALDLAKRAMVSLLLRVAALYAVTVKVKRDSPDGEVKRAFRQVCKKVTQTVGVTRRINNSSTMRTLLGRAPSAQPKRKLPTEKQPSEHVLQRRLRKIAFQVEL